MLDWQDGQPFSKRYGDVYFSADSGLDETRHVFLQGNRLEERFAALSAGESFCIGETGFGTGLNFLCAWQLFERVAPPGASLDYFSVEKFPLSDDDLRAALALWPELAAQAEILFARWHRRVPGWNRWSFAGGRVRLTLAMEDVEQALPQLPACCVDAWFLDGFSPAKNPEMWSDAVLAGIARASRAGATLATYTCAGWVRRGLQQAGFEVERVEGFGRKREMVRGYLPSVRTECLAQQGVSKYERKTPDTAIVIGGGIAGCAAAHALAQRGISVTLIESASQLAATEAEAKRIAKLSAQEWPAHLLQAVDAARASELVGMKMAHGGLWFPAGGWVVPPQVCARLADHPLIARRLGCEVTALERTASGWRASGEGFAVEAEQVVVCSGHQAKNLSQFAAFPLQPVRGQISILSATAASKTLHAVLCAEGYCAPAVAGQHVAGATSTFDDAATDLREADHGDNLAKIAAHISTLYQALSSTVRPELLEGTNETPAGISPLAGRAGVRCSVPGATPLVGEVEPGLYCSLAHGTRGLLTAGIAGEVIAAAMCRQLPPLPQSLLDALAPLPRVQNKGKCAA